MSRLEFGEFHVNSVMMAEQDRFLASIIQSARDAIIGLDAGSMMLSWNHGAELLFGFTESEMIGMPLSRLVPPDRRREQEIALNRIFAGETVAAFRSVRTKASGQDIAVLVTMSPVCFGDGTVFAASAIIRPVAPTLHRPDAIALSDHREAERSTVDRRNILVVDDEALAGLGLTAMLENVGHDVIGPAGNIQSAMTLIDSHGCVLAILAPTLRSGEACAPLAQRLKRDGIPFFVTSNDSAARPAAIFSDAPYFPKPVRSGALLAAVQQVLSGD